MEIRLVLFLAAGLAATLLVLVGPFARADTDALTVDIVVSPSNIVLSSEGVWVTVHAEIAYSAVYGAGVTLDGVPVSVTKADSRGEFVAKFDLDAVREKLEPGVVTLTLRGTTASGETFVGSDTVRVTAGGDR